jgi:1-acyl-sn-glycerol-3-phosphate acyltransferase
MDLSYRIGRFFFKILSFLYFPTRVYGRGHIPKDKSFILAANHASNIDPFVIGTFCGRILSFVAKESLFKNKLLGLWLSSLNAFPIRRDTADFRAVRETLRRLKKKPVLIFPEGTRKGSREERKAQGGIGLIAVKSQAPIIPVYIKDSDKVLPPKAKWFKRHQVVLIFGPPVDLPLDMSYQDMSQRIIQAVYQLAQ